MLLKQLNANKMMVGVDSPLLQRERERERHRIRARHPHDLSHSKARLSGEASTVLSSNTVKDNVIQIMSRPETTMLSLVIPSRGPLIATH